MINHKNSEFYQILKKEPNILPILVGKLIKIIESFHNKGIIYGNLRPQNIIIKLNPPALRMNDVIEHLELIDFSQTFKFSEIDEYKKSLLKNQDQHRYLPPEIIEGILCSKYNAENRELIHSHPHEKEEDEDEISKQAKEIDFWALGMIILELILGFPVNLEQECTVKHFNTRKEFIAKGSILTGLIPSSQETEQIEQIYRN